ncbi:hypothetical protein POM88_032747 [Heracleum sosnowskyi]|uniref:PB1-like domain-containing protein n=1 Tax=Heracleum sosnowskyi TaxID=360622 RepID=A0AAD8HZX8_9APIA|nr:hypothetical protein POM88_032747 [Heracleum sosnowskyi]
MEWFRRSKENMHKYGDAECPNYKDYPSFFTIKLYYGGHFENLNSKFVGYKIDYFDFCNVDFMSIFEVGSMVSECIGRKSAGIELYFKAPNEGMEEIGKLENDADVLVMTGLISENHPYVKVFAVLISTEPIGIEGLPIGNTQTAPPSSPIVVISVNEDSEADEDWHPDSSNDGNSKQDEMVDEEDDDVTSVNRGETGYMTKDDNEIEFNDETIAGSEDEKMAGLALRGLMWSAARSTIDYHFDKNMAEIQKLNIKCYEWLSAKPKEHWSRTCKTKKNEEKRPEQNEAEEGEQYQRAEENQPNQVEQEQRHEFSPGASQPTIEVNDSQGGIFGPPPGKRTTAACGVAPKAWQNKKQTVTTRTEILRARSVREKKATQRYHD